MKLNINSHEIHAQLIHNKHLVNGALVVVTSLWPIGTLVFF
jgi:hypothetical protein